MLAQNQASNVFAIKDEQLALRKCLLFMDAFRAIRRIMPMQHAYAFLLVALEEGRGGSGIRRVCRRHTGSDDAHPVALGSRSRGRARGYGLVRQGIDTEDARKHQTFLTAKGKALMREIVRLIRSDQAKLRSRDLTLAPESTEDVARDQWLSRLVAVGRKLDREDMKIAVHLVETLMRYRRSI